MMPFCLCHIPRFLQVGARYLSTSLKKTIFYEFHQKNGAKMVPFAGWTMPISYSDGIVESHNNVRSEVGMFDVSHMQQIKILGEDRVSFLESLTVANLSSLKIDHAALSLITTKNGGIVDDLIISKCEDHLYCVTNAGKAHDVLTLLQKHASDSKFSKHVSVVEANQGLIAVQGPAMQETLQPHLSGDLSKLLFMNTSVMTVFGVPNCRVTRCGYTGEDGVEISIPLEDAERIANKLLSIGISPVGLGARDTLRLEAGLCLSGNDFDETVSPVEASLSWTIGKRRRRLANFPGAKVILEQLQNGAPRKRVGFVCNGPPPREGTEILDASGSEEKVGHITSGGFSPTTKQNIGMGLISTDYLKRGSSDVLFRIRGKTFKGRIADLPFVKCHYYRG